ncbi:MAG: tyrosine-type recombinase/integrase [Bacteroidia bacterium]|nr:tyrosine-type recombinase/integrase [Bacteroidia bacterium]
MTSFPSRCRERELVKESKPAEYVYMHVSYVKEMLVFVEESTVTDVCKVDQTLMDTYLNYLQTQRRKQRGEGLLDEQTIARHKGAIRQFFKYLVLEGYKVFPIRIYHKRKKAIGLPTVLTHEEIRQLYSVCDDSAIGHRDRCSLAIFYGCGMRKSEGLRLLVSDIDFSRSRIHVRKAKNNRERYVMMSPTVQVHVEEYVYNYRDLYLPEGSTYDELFISERGLPVKPETAAKRMEALWQRVKDRYGSDKRVGIHTLRHTLGTQLYMVGMSIEMIALMLGHVTLEATQRYIHIANHLKK